MVIVPTDESPWYFLEIFVDQINHFAMCVDFLSLGRDLRFGGRNIIFLIDASVIVNAFNSVGCLLACGKHSCSPLPSSCWVYFLFLLSFYTLFGKFISSFCWVLSFLVIVVEGAFACFYYIVVAYLSLSCCCGLLLSLLLILVFCFCLFIDNGGLDACEHLSKHMSKHMSLVVYFSIFCLP